MGNANIPDDWTGDYINYVVKWPLSEQWEAILRGQLTAPKFEDFWDLFSGDPETSQDAMDETLDTNLHLQEEQLIPPGTLSFYSIETIPEGWLWTDGSAVSRSEYAALFDVIGTTFGEGNGTTTFNLPEIMGRVIVAFNPLDETFDEIGETLGTQTVTITTDTMPSHNHTQNAHNHTQNAHNHPQIGSLHTSANQVSINAAAAGSLNTTLGVETPASVSAVNQATTATNQNTGGGLPHSNIQPSVVFPAMIKT